MSLETFEGKEVVIGSPAYVLFSSFSDLRNFASRIPKEYLDKVTISEDSVFGSYGGIDMGLKVVERIPNSRVVMKPQGSFPVDFSLVFTLKELSAGSTAVRVSIESEMNFMVKAMLGRKIQDMVDKVTESLQAAASGTGAPA